MKKTLTIITLMYLTVAITTLSHCSALDTNCSTSDVACNPLLTTLLYQGLPHLWVTGDQHYIKVTHDGKQWEGVDAPPIALAAQPYHIEISMDRTTVIVGIDVLTSSRLGYNWATNFNPDWNDSKYFKNYFYASNSTTSIYTSPNGKDWAPSDLTSVYGANNVSKFLTNGKVLIGSVSDGSTIFSTDGMNWQTGGAAILARGSVYANEYFVLGGLGANLGTVAYSSNNGINWTVENIVPSVSDIYNLSYNNNHFEFIDNAGVFCKSQTYVPTGWTCHTTTLSQITSMAYFKNKYYAVDFLGQMCTSTDTLTWSCTTVNSGGQLYSLNIHYY